MTRNFPTVHTAELLTIGAELLKGSVLNTNAQFLSAELKHLGFQVTTHVTCDDQIPAITKRLGEAFSRSELVIATGGLGPTPDDVTRDAVADFFKVPLVFSKTQFAAIASYYRKFGYRVSEQVRKEAYYPENAVPLINRYGVALGFYLHWENRMLVVLPGVPYELECMYHELVKPLLKRHFRNLKPKPCLIAKTIGVPEPDVMTRLGKDFFDVPFDFGIYPETGEVTLRIYADREKILSRLRSKIKTRLKNCLYALHETSLAETIGLLLTHLKKTLAVAESCTGGLLASEITKVAGSSQYFAGGLIAYSNEVKKKLGVPERLLIKKGAVSEDVARKLAEEIREHMNSDYGIGVTGVAGPSGGSTKKPVGLVYISVATLKQSIVGKFLFRGNRRQVQIKATKKALEMLWREIKSIKK